jgi:phospholipid transport system substrate-binding protein
VLLAWATPPAHAGTPTERLREFFNAVDGLLADSSVEPLDKVARVKRLVNDISDVRAAAASALDHEWETRTPAEREEFTALFAELLERAYVGRLAGTVRVSTGMAMTWGGETVTKDEATVRTTLPSRDGDLLSVEYRMVQRRGSWFVRDVVLDGVSVVENYRAQFRRLLGRGSYGELVATVRAKLSEETLMFARADRAVLARVEELAASVVAPLVTVMERPGIILKSPPLGPPRPPARVLAPPARIAAPPVRIARPSAALVGPPPVRVIPARKPAVVPPAPVAAVIDWLIIPAPLAADGDGGVLPPPALPGPRVSIALIPFGPPDAVAVALRALLLSLLAALVAAQLRRRAAVTG